ncbi:MAG: hypothetical protein WCD88_06095 [Desulfobacterales bacterium]
MPYYIAIFIDSYREGFIVVACLLMLVYLAGNRIRYRQYLLDRRLAPPTGPGFSAQVMARMVGQQTEKSLAAVIRTIVDERARLRQWVEESMLRAEGRSTGEPAAGRALPETPPAEHPEVVGQDCPPHRYAKIPQLAESGQTPRQIAAAIDRPLAEVEFYLALARRRSARAAEEKPEKLAALGKNFRLVPMRRVV